jgi:hypothetical protein
MTNEWKQRAERAEARVAELETAQGAAGVLAELWNSVLPTDLDAPTLRGTRLRMKVLHAMMNEKNFGLTFIAALRALAAPTTGETP